MLQMENYSLLGIVALAQLVNARAAICNKKSCEVCSNIDNITYELAEKLSKMAIHM